MSHPLDEDTSTMRMRLAAMPIELRKREHRPPPSRVRGIAIGVLLGAAIWAAIVAVGVAIWRWIIG
jgi:hypothetical protein